MYVKKIIDNLNNVKAAYKQCTSGKNEKNKQERKNSVHMPLHRASYNHFPPPA